MPPIPCSRRGFEFTAGGYLAESIIRELNTQQVDSEIKVEVVTYPSDWEHNGPKGLSPSRVERFDNLGPTRERTAMYLDIR
jgi:hypothetical protein